MNQHVYSRSEIMEVVGSLLKEYKAEKRFSLDPMRVRKQQQNPMLTLSSLAEAHLIRRMFSLWLTRCTLVWEKE